MSKWIYTLILLAVGAYVLSPVDLVPDFFIGLGWLDDAALIALLFRGIYLYNRAKKIKNTTNKTNQDDAPIEVDFKDIDE